ncbi:VOC family protein [Actinophytocola sp.]|uniref:VOC family protein n=1 Tax=Actinophytocola sp. TaxID=1872138 RepID=UPI003D6AE8E2
MTRQPTDPFEALREPVTPVDPNPDFAGRLRLRLTREVFAQPGGIMSEQTVAQRVEREPAWGPTLEPYIVVADARRALAWYVEVLGGEQRGEPYTNADGTIGHAEVGLGDAVLMLSEPSDLWPDVPVRAPDSPMHSHTLHLQVDDVDATTERARRRGAAVEREPTDQPYGRGSVIVDPFGHRWMLLRPPASATRFRQGDIAHVTMVAPDAVRAKDFYEAVLRVPFAPGGTAGAWGTEATNPPLGMWSPPDAAPQVQLCFRVDDIAAAVERVRAAGGSAAEVERKPYGLLVECDDDQGFHFQLWQPSD